MGGTNMELKNTVNKKLIKLNYEKALKNFYIEPSTDNTNSLFKAYDDTLILRNKLNEDKTVYEKRIAQNKEKLSEIEELEQKLYIMDTQLNYIKNSHNGQQIEAFWKNNRFRRTTIQDEN